MMNDPWSPVDAAMRAERVASEQSGGGSPIVASAVERLHYAEESPPADRWTATFHYADGSTYAYNGERRLYAARS